MIACLKYLGVDPQHGLLPCTYKDDHRLSFFPKGGVTWVHIVLAGQQTWSWPWPTYTQSCYSHFAKLAIHSYIFCASAAWCQLQIPRHEQGIACEGFWKGFHSTSEVFQLDSATPEWSCLQPNAAPGCQTWQLQNLWEDNAEQASG